MSRLLEQTRSTTIGPPNQLVDITAPVTTVNSVSVAWSSSSLPSPLSARFICLALAVKDGGGGLVECVELTDGETQGVVEAHFLPAELALRVVVFLSNEDEGSKPIGKTAEFSQVRTKKGSGGWHDDALYVGPEHHISGWIMKSPGDWLWTRARNLLESRQLFEQLFELGVFALPHRGQDMVPLIHPEDRYCIDLEVKARWDGKKVRRHAKDFTMTISKDFDKSVQLARRHHGRMGTWFTQDLADLFSAMHKDSNSRVRHEAFELWEGDEQVAVVLGFGKGCVWHDYTMCALKRDNRSCGNILSKAVGDLLAKCGYSLWYWGLKCPYMQEYDTKGGRHFNRDQFWERWSTQSAKQPQIALQTALSQNMGLVPPS